MASATDGANIGFSAPHGLVQGQAIASANEVRFVAAIVDARQRGVERAIFDGSRGRRRDAGRGHLLAGYVSAERFGLRLLDPATAVQRVLRGAAVDQMEISVNGDFHEFQFSGLAQDVIDSSSFSAGGRFATELPSRAGDWRLRLLDCSGKS